jgi:endonuclease YncB( thermonuclease family)
MEVWNTMRNELLAGICAVAILAGMLMGAACAPAGATPTVSAPPSSPAPPLTTSSLPPARQTTAPPAATTTLAPSTTVTSAGEDVRALVLKVVDGDTLQVRILGGDPQGTAAGAIEDLRLIGIDAPESGEDFSSAATAALSTLCAGAEVSLQQDEETRDQYGRLLAYVFLEDETFVNAQMLRLGLATIFTVAPNVEFVPEFQAAQEVAQTAKAGIWAAAKPSPLEIVEVRYDPPGDDTLDLNQEYIVFKVVLAGNLRGYSVEDESGKRFDFPSRAYLNGQTIILHSGKGANTSADLYWGVSGSAIWNNSGDTVKVLDPQGHIVATYAY